VSATQPVSIRGSQHSALPQPTNALITHQDSHRRTDLAESTGLRAG
jgi:hypothetical protein